MCLKLKHRKTIDKAARSAEGPRQVGRGLGFWTSSLRRQGAQEEFDQRRALHRLQLVRLHHTPAEIIRTALQSSSHLTLSTLR